MADIAHISGLVATGASWYVWATLHILVFGCHVDMHEILVLPMPSGQESTRLLSSTATS